MGTLDPPDYEAMLAAAGGHWDAFARGPLADTWMARYAASTPWTAEVMGIDQGSLTFLYDGAPTLNGAGGSEAADRVVGVWGRSTEPAGRRDSSRLAGFVPDPDVWSGRGRDRGHLIGHAAGGGLDLNLLPQASALNRGRSAAGKRWRSMERHAARHPGTPLFVCPVYEGPGWVPVWLEFGLLVDGRLWFERFANA